MKLVSAEICLNGTHRAICLLCANMLRSSLSFSAAFQKKKKHPSNAQPHPYSVIYLSRTLSLFGEDVLIVNRTFADDVIVFISDGMPSLHAEGGDYQAAVQFGGATLKRCDV